MLVKPSFKKITTYNIIIFIGDTDFASNNSEQIPIGKLPEWVVPNLMI